VAVAADARRGSGLTDNTGRYFDWTGPLVETEYWDEEKAKSVIGLYCLIHVNFVSQVGDLEYCEQMHGTIVETNRFRGIRFELKGKCEGREWWGPPELSNLNPAPGSGVFDLSETGEKIVDPDLIAFWTVYSTKKEDGTNV
jgi:hypothetical protein